MESASAALQRLCDPSVEVSAHYLIGGDGTCWQMVAEDQRAWHAGAGEWNGLDDINSRSIGIELDNLGTHPFSEPQMARLEELLVDIMTRWAIPSENVIGHSCMAPGRKHDPGPHFDWTRLAAQSLAIPGGYGPSLQDASRQTKLFRSLAQERGFTADVDHETLLQAVRLRYRPAGRGPLAPEDFCSLGDGTR